MSFLDDNGILFDKEAVDTLYFPDMHPFIPFNCFISQRVCDWSVFN